MRETPIYDRARELLSDVEETRLLPSSVLDASDDGVRLQVAAAMIAANLAVAEALHGVVYTANANAV